MKAAVLVASAALALLNVGSKQTLAQTLQAEINRVRAEHGLPALSSSRKLRQIAKAKAHAILRAERFAHDVGPIAQGENLAWSNYLTPQQIVDRWLNSPGHRRNLLGEWRHIGLWVTRPRSLFGHECVRVYVMEVSR